MTRLRLLATALLLLLTPALGAERIPVKSYSTGEGLAHYSINRIARDSRGFLWFCTREGLSRFDGYEFVSYRAADGLPSSWVTDLLETRSGEYWIGTIDGLVRFNPSGAERFTTFRPGGDPRTAMAHSLVEDAGGHIWVGTAGGLFRVDGERTAPSFVSIDLGIADQLFARAIQSLMADRSGALWIAAGPGIFVRAPDGRLQSITVSEGLPSGTVYDFLEDRDGRIWAATTEGLWALDRDGGGKPRLARIFRASDGLPSEWVTDIFEAADGMLWVGTAKGLARLDAARGVAQARFTAYGPAHGIPAAGVTTIEADAGGHLWVGWQLHGAMRWPRNGVSVFGPEEGIAAASSIVRTADDGIAFINDGADGWAVVCSEGESFRPVKLRGDLGGRSWGWKQLLVQDSHKAWWLGTNNGLFRFPPTPSCRGLDGASPVAHYDSRTGLAADVVIRLFEDSRGDMWIATVGHGQRPDGLSRWSRRTGTMHSFTSRDGLPTFERHYVSALGEDRQGNVWVGFSRDGGLAKYSNGHFTLFTKADGLPAGQVRDILVDGAGRLWAASYRGGLCRIEKPEADAPLLRTYTTSHGLSSNEIHGLVEDDRGHIYVSSARGIDRLDPATDRLSHYTAADGVPEGELNAAVRGPKGDLWFAYFTGLLRFRPASDVARAAPQVWIAGVSIEGEHQAVSSLGELNVAAMRLPYTRNSLQVTFLAVGGGSGEFHYRYKLEGAGEWSAFAAQRTVNFANLSPGAYRLLVEARDARGAVSDRPASFAFTIVPPLWLRTPVIALAGAFLVFGAFAFHRYRTGRLTEIARIRDRIAADLHDDLGANLTKIAVLGEVARQQTARGDAALASIAGIARESVATMSDIVWAVDPGRDNLDDLIRKMRQHATETFALGDVLLVFNAPKAVAARQMAIGVRHDAFLIFKEVINNAARHAQCRRVVVEVRVEHRALVIHVQDDGIGFDPATDGAGRGSSTMRQRAARLGAVLDVTSEPGRGTAVALTIPLA